MRHVIVELHTGRIIGEYDQANIEYIPTADPAITAETYYWDGAKLAPRPQQVSHWSKNVLDADGTDHIVITGLSQHASVMIQETGRDLHVDPTGLVQLSFTEPGTYTLVVEDFPKAKYVQHILARSVTSTPVAWTPPAITPVMPLPVTGDGQHTVIAGFIFDFHDALVPLPGKTATIVYNVGAADITVPVPLQDSLAGDEVLEHLKDALLHETGFLTVFVSGYTLQIVPDMNVVLSKFDVTIA